MPEQPLPASLRRAVAAWSAQDPDPATRAETERLLTAAEDGDPGPPRTPAPS